MLFEQLVINSQKNGQSGSSVELVQTFGYCGQILNTGKFMINVPFLLVALFPEYQNNNNDNNNNNHDDYNTQKKQTNFEYQWW